MNKLKRNPDKVEVLLINRKADQGIEIQPKLDGVRLPLKTQACHFGVLLELVSESGCLVSAVSRSAFAKLKLLHQQFPFLEMSDLVMAIHPAWITVTPSI